LRWLTTTTHSGSIRALTRSGSGSVDDILTTGSTLRYAARACRQQKREICVLSLTRTALRG